MHIFSKRGYLQCVFVHWRDLGSKSKSTAYLLENWNSSTTAPGALFSPWWSSTASSDRLCCSSWSCFGSAAALSVCTLPAYPRLKNHPFAARGLLMSAQHCLVFVLGFQSWRVDSQGDKSKLRSIEVKVRGPTLPATRSNITKSVTVTTTYNRPTILSGTAASAQYKMAKAALHLN